ncbi:uncharacterized protein ATNIH1004_002083 [Aspergillus tanneri]|uniref:Uncharacterized protein n=1 Tax=Aspergillus tanneri TaxID=1220188 RepID=A0A5M9MQM0_9EURO|nr:uncharacterized protein ATNIH1004_002083 [Aspergillus tanneri]KAA8649412.1 hypothetical protein ATNIH1004_002083 [Aspergillus tanneri]
MSPDRYSPDTRMDDLASTTSPPREISATGSPHSHGSGELFQLSHIIPQSTQNIAPNPTRRSQSHDSTELFETQVISHVIPQSTQNIAPNPTPTVSIAERQRQRVQDQRYAAPHIQHQAQDARQWLDEETIEQEIALWQKKSAIFALLRVGNGINTSYTFAVGPKAIKPRHGLIWFASIRFYSPDIPLVTAVICRRRSVDDGRY